jgi:hypothetical protein
MSRTLFENSKAALAFAGITIVSTALMLAPGDDGGMLDRAVDLYAGEREAIVEEAQAFAEEQSVPDEVFDPASGWASNGEEAFGDFLPEDMAGEQEAPVMADIGDDVVSSRPKPNIVRRIGGRPPASPPVVADNAGELVPRPDQASASDAPRGVAVITDRQMTIEPM